VQFSIRQGTARDAPFLGQMIYEAAFNPQRSRPPLDEALRLPHAARWLAGWGRPGDAALLAVDPAGNPLGAACYRLFAAYEQGNEGFVDRGTPVVAMAVVPACRGQGIGTALLTALKERARAHGFHALSLSVGSTNPALRLYERLGFVRVHMSEMGPWTMRAPLS
jgi:ribosomal protein S18 acetylase RimI-like enzyme